MASLVSVEYEKTVDSFQDVLDRNILFIFSKGAKKGFSMDIPYYYKFLSGSVTIPMFKYSPDPVLRKVQAESVRRGGTRTRENAAILNKMIEDGKAAS